MKQRIGLNTLAISILFPWFLMQTILVKSQDFEEEFDQFIGDINKEFEIPDSVYSEEVDKINKDFHEFKRELDNEFADFLREGFHELEMLTPEIYDNSNEPTRLDTWSGAQSINQSVQLGEHLKDNKTSYESSLPIIISGQGGDYQYLISEFLFFSQPISLKFDNAYSNIPGEYTAGQIGELWERLCSTHYQDLLLQVRNSASLFNLNDWGYFLLIQKSAEEITGDNESALLLSWFLMLKSGYKVKIGFSNEQPILLYATLQNVYNTPYVRINNEKYYPFRNKSILTITTYDFKYPEAENLINLVISSPMFLPRGDGEQSNLKLPVNENYIKFYATFPQTEFYIYQNAPLSEVLRQYVLQNLKSELETKADSITIPFLLNYVQKKFRYERDAEQFNQEKFMFPEEVFFYPASDCEDRAILFSWLIRELLGYQTIALSYSGHILIGIENENLTGINCTFNQKRYLLTDPSFIDAPPGIVPPEFINLEPEPISLDLKIPGEPGIKSMLKSEEILMASFSKDLAHDSNGKYVIAGYLHNGNTKNTDICITQFNTKDEIQWQNCFRGSGNDYAYDVVYDDSLNIYFLASFSDTLFIEEEYLVSGGQQTYLIIKTDTLGIVKWYYVINPSNTQGSKKNTSFAAEISSSGELTYLDSMSLPDALARNRMQFINGNIRIEITTLESNSLEVDSLRFEKGDEFEIIDWLVRENSRLIKSNYHSKVSGLLAIIKLLYNTNQILSGDLLLEALKKFQSDSVPETKSYLAEIEKIDEIYNRHGLVTCILKEDPTLNFGKVKFESELKLKIQDLESTTKINVISGLQIGMNTSWYDINFIIINKYTGEILYDYDNHYRQKLPMRAEVIL